MRIFFKCFTFLLLAFFSFAHAEEEAPPVEKKIYYKLEPDIVVNYGDKGRFRFIRTEISLLVTSSESQKLVDQHRAYIRNNVILFLSAQDVKMIKNPNAREQLRTKLLADVQALMKKLEGKSCVDQLYFTNFIVQS